MNSLPSDRKSALLLESGRFFTGRPCRRGHVAERYTGSGDCVECAFARAGRHYATKGEQIKQRLRENYAADPAPLRAKSRAAREKDPELTRTKKRAEYERHKPQYIARSASWTREHRDRYRALHKRWRDRNPVKLNHWAALGRALRLVRRPKWLTAEQRRKIRAFYAEARALTLASGVEHEVDHIVPLRGETVSGLHVPWNLQILTADSNRAKSNKY